MIDHDHHTGLIRGLLCTSCNHHEGRHTTPALTIYRDDPPSKRLGIFEHYRRLWGGIDWGRCTLPCPCGIPPGEHLVNQLANLDQDCPCYDDIDHDKTRRAMANAWWELLEPENAPVDVDRVE